MSNLNKVMLIGRLGGDPESRNTKNGKTVCNFSIATSEKWVDDQRQAHERTEWHRIVVYGKLAEICQKFLAKGRQCFVEGKLQTRQWENKEGQKQYTTEILAASVQFLGNNAHAPSNNSSNNSAQDDEIPF